MSAWLLSMLLNIGCLVAVTNPAMSVSPRLGTPPGSNVDCPSGCTCSKDTVDCTLAEYETVPVVPAKTRTVILNGNRIVRVQRAELGRMANLEELHLRGNQVRHIAVHSGVRWLDISENPLRCDCQLLWPMDSLTTRTLLHSERTRCQLSGREPVTIADARLLLMDECRGFRRRRRAREPRSNKDSLASSCASDTCSNDGTCQHTMVGWSCLCQPGYSGVRCERVEGETLTLTVDGHTASSIDLAWAITSTDVIDFKLEYWEVPMEPHLPAEQEWFESAVRQCTIVNLQPDTEYKICLSAYAYQARKRSPGNVIAVSCLYQRTRQAPTTAGEPLTFSDPMPTSLISSPEDKSTESAPMQAAMAIFLIILAVCILLMLMVTVVYCSARRGIHLIPQGHGRRLSIVQITNPAIHGISDSPPTVGRDGDGDNDRAEEDPIFIVIDGMPEGEGAGAGIPMRAASSKEDDAPDNNVSVREDGDGVSFHENEPENSVENDEETTELETKITQC